MNTTTKRHVNNTGFTLIEVMIAICVLSIAMIGIYNLFAKNMKAHVSQELTLELTQDLRAVLNLMTTEIRMAGYDPTKVGGIGFRGDPTNDDRYNTDTNSIRFTMDLDQSGTTLQTGEEINYFIDDNKRLIRRIDGASAPSQDVAADNITDLKFTYLDSNNQTTLVLANIRTVKISLTGKARSIDPLLNQVKTRTETALIKVRNLGLPS